MLQAIDVRLVDQPGPSLWITAGLPVLGVLLGAALAGGVRLLLDRRAEHARFRAAVWLLLDDLARMRAVLDPEVGPLSPLGTTRSELDHDLSRSAWLQSGAWENERATLALGLRRHRETWDRVRWTMMEVDVLLDLVPAQKTDVSAERVMRWVGTQEQLVRRIDDVTARLEPMAARRRGRWRRAVGRLRHLRRVRA